MFEFKNQMNMTIAPVNVCHLRTQNFFSGGGGGGGGADPEVYIIHV